MTETTDLRTALIEALDNLDGPNGYWADKCDYGQAIPNEAIADAVLEVITRWTAKEPDDER